MKRLSDKKISIDYILQRSRRYKRLTLKVSPLKGLIVSAPSHVSVSQIEAFIYQQSDWIHKHLDAVRQQLSDTQAALNDLPTQISLLAVNELWQVDYQTLESDQLTLKVDFAQQQLAMSGKVSPVLVHDLLRKWLANRAKTILKPWLYELSQATGLHYQRCSIRNQKTRWGSCSSSGTISLNAKLLFLGQTQVNHVLLHELCHTQEPNHSANFWALLQKHDEQTKQNDASLREAWHTLPLWAHANI